MLVLLENCCEKNVPAIQARSQASPRFPGTQGNCWRPQGPGAAACAWSQSSFGIDNAVRAACIPGGRRSDVRNKIQYGAQRSAPVETLKQRREFLRIRGGQRWSCGAFVIETRNRPECEADVELQGHGSDIHSDEAYRQCGCSQPCQTSVSRRNGKCAKELAARRQRLCVDRKIGRVKTSIRRSDQRLARRTGPHSSTETQQPTREAHLNQKYLFQRTCDCPR